MSWYRIGSKAEFDRLQKGVWERETPQANLRSVTDDAWADSARIAALRRDIAGLGNLSRSWGVPVAVGEMLAATTILVCADTAHLSAADAALCRCEIVTWLSSFLREIGGLSLCDNNLVPPQSMPLAVGAEVWMWVWWGVGTVERASAEQLREVAILGTLPNLGQWPELVFLLGAVRFELAQRS